MPYKPWEDFICIGKHRSKESLLNAHSQVILVEEWQVLQTCQDFTFLRIKTPERGTSGYTRVKLRKAVYDELKSQCPARWYLCQVRAPWGVTWIAVWDDKKVTEPTPVSDVFEVKWFDHWIATHLTLEWLLQENMETCYRQSIECIQFVNIMVELYLNGISFTKSLRWCREMLFMQAEEVQAGSTWRASCLRQWKKRGSGAPNAFQWWMTPVQKTAKQTHEPELAKTISGLVSMHSPCEKFKKHQDEVGKNEPPPDSTEDWTQIKSQDGAGQNKPPPCIQNTFGAVDEQDEVGYDEPPPRVSGVPGRNNCSTFTTCSEEHPGGRLGRGVSAMDDERHSDPGDWIGWIFRNRQVSQSRYPLVAAGGAARWTSVRAAFLRPHATLGERLVFAEETEGWMATDEWAFAASRVRRAASQFHFLPVAIYSHVADDFIFESEDVHVPNTGVSLLPVLFGGHWIGIEIDKQHDLPEIAILQCSQANQHRIETFICHVLQNLHIG